MRTKEKNRRLKKFLNYDTKALKSAIKEAGEVPDYHDPGYFDYMKKKQRSRKKAKKTGLKSNLHRRDGLH